MKYFSKSKNLKVSIGKKLIEFKNIGGIGIFETEDEKLIQLLESHKNFKISGIGSFTVMKLNAKASNVIQGQRGATTEELDKVKEKFKGYETLKTKIVKVDGEFRYGTDEKDIDRYNTLREELGLK